MYLILSVCQYLCTHTYVSVSFFFFFWFDYILLLLYRKRERSVYNRVMRNVGKMLYTKCIYVSA